jgi:hypothetical protein
MGLRMIAMLFQRCICDITIKSSSILELSSYKNVDI